MLDTLRKYASGWVAQLLMAVLVLSFAVWGVSDIFTGFHANSIAQVGSAQVSLAEFQRRYDIAMQTLSARLGQAISPQQAIQFGVPNQILNQLVFEATLDDAANKMGIGISNQTLGEKISQDPQLFGPSGTFDRSYLNNLISAQRMTQDQFIINRREQYIRDQIVDAFGGGLVAPDAYMRAIHEYTTEERSISYLVINAPSQADIADPSEADLADYFAAHKSEYRTPELRALQYFTLSPDQIANAADVSDADAKQRYDSQTARFSTPEKRDVQQIVFKDRAAAAAAAAAISSGKTFDDILAEQKLKPADVDLGLITRDKIIDPAVAKAAFALPEGGVSGVVDGQFGPVIVRVTKIEPAVVTPFDQVKESLKKEIATERAASSIQNLHDAIEDMRAGGATLDEVSAKYDLKLVKVAAVDSNGNNADGKPVADLPKGLVSAAFQSDVGLENNPLEPAPATYVWYTVTNVTAPRDRTLSEVHDQVVSAWKDEQRQKKLTAESDAAKSRLDGGTAIATVGTDLSLPVQTADSLTRRSKPSGDLSAAVIQAAFTGPKGTVEAADGAQPMTRVLLVVNDVTTPTYFSGAPDLAQAQTQLSSQMEDDLLALYGAQIRSHTEVRLNQAALQQALGVSAN
jgi:peptidyl-prolyl cis-trans isomerase D